MAHAALISLKQTIQRLLNSSHLSIVSPTLQIIEFANKDVQSLQEFLERLDHHSSKTLNAFEERIRAAVHKLADSLEFHVSDHYLSRSAGSVGVESCTGILPLSLEEIRQEFSSFAETTKKMEEEYVKELDNPSLQEGGDDDDDDEEDEVFSSITDFYVQIVGLSNELMELRNYTLNIIRPDDFGVFAIVGKAGSGRTKAAKTIFEDLCINHTQFFDCGAWVTVGLEYQLREILLTILSQIDDRLVITCEDDEELCEYLHASLKGKRYMIVLDDVLRPLCDHLRRSFPPQNNGSLILLTTSVTEIALSAYSYFVCEVRVIDEDVIWDFIYFTMFVLNSCPQELEVAGRKIAENCRGLRIPFIKAVLFLCKGEKTLEYWNKLAGDEENSVFKVEDEISEMCKIKEDLQLCNSFPDDDQRTLIVELVRAVLLQDSDQIQSIKTNMFPKRLFPKLEIVSFVGMAGIGKTRLVKEVFDDPVILHHFDHWVWVTLGPKYQSKEILVDILAQIYHDINKVHIKEDEELAKDLCQKLENKRCLIVLDDVWNQEPLHYLKKSFPNIKGKAFVTTRLAKVAQFGECDMVHEMSLLNKEESWCLLRQKVFATSSCPFNLEKVGRKIAENCDGLPLTILKVANLLCKAEKTPEYWNMVAERKNSLFADVYEEISKVLLSSYNSLPQHLKACLLYLGVFLQNFEIPSCKIIKLLIAEGFLGPDPSHNVEDFASDCLWELVQRNLVMVCQKGSNSRFKTCRLHSVYWHLSNSEAVKNNFFHSFTTYADSSTEFIKSQRRLCIRNGSLLGMKDVQDSIVSISSACSLLFTGPSHQYPVPVCFGLRLMKVLDALAIRLYEFPVEVVKLFHLRYLALTCDGKIPSSISKLQSLEILVLSQHISIITNEDSSHLPLEIWDMKELNHFQVKGSNLPKPNLGDVLPNLVTLLDVGVESCCEEVFKGIPNLKRLGIRIELAPDNDGKTLGCLDFVSQYLHVLESLKCVVVNPELHCGDFPPLVPVSMFPLGLKKLTLSGLGYPWEYMSIVCKLENLEVLKLRCYAFQGPVWVTNHLTLNRVKYLSIEDTDLVRWKLNSASFANLESLCIKHCYNLEDLPCAVSNSVKKIEVVDCNNLVVTWAEQMKNSIKLQIHSSWDVGNLNYKPSTWFIR